MTQMQSLEYIVCLLSFSVYVTFLDHRVICKTFFQVPSKHKTYPNISSYARTDWAIFLLLDYKFIAIYVYSLNHGTIGKGLYLNFDQTGYWNNNYI